MVDMIPDHRHDLFQVFRVTDLLFNVSKGEELVADDLAEFFGELLLPFGENPMKSDAKYSFRFTGVKKHFNGHPVGHPANEGGNKRDKYDNPDIHSIKIK